MEWSEDASRTVLTTSREGFFGKPRTMGQGWREGHVAVRAAGGDAATCMEPRETEREARRSTEAETRFPQSAQNDGIGNWMSNQRIRARLGDATRGSSRTGHLAE
jgi:hypothetical protein